MQGEQVGKLLELVDSVVMTGRGLVNDGTKLARDARAAGRQVLDADIELSKSVEELASDLATAVNAVREVFHRIDKLIP